MSFWDVTWFTLINLENSDTFGSEELRQRLVFIGDNQPYGTEWLYTFEIYVQMQ